MLGHLRRQRLPLAQEPRDLRLRVALGGGDGARAAAVGVEGRVAQRGVELGDPPLELGDLLLDPEQALAELEGARGAASLSRPGRRGRGRWGRRRRRHRAGEVVVIGAGVGVESPARDLDDLGIASDSRLADQIAEISNLSHRLR